MSTASNASAELATRAPSLPAASALCSTQPARLLALPAAMRRLPAPLRLTPDDAIMLAAMVTGDRTYLIHSLRVGFERTGSFHMLVVSGFHLAIVAGCIFWLARRLRLPRVPGHAPHHRRLLWLCALHRLRHAGPALAVDGHPLPARPPPLPRTQPHEHHRLCRLCLLAVNPRSLFDSSLQMTLLAVVAIAGVAAPLLQGTIHPYVNATRDLRLMAIDAKLSPPLAQFRVTLRFAAAQLQNAGNDRLAWRIFPWLIRFLIRLVELVVISASSSWP